MTVIAHHLIWTNYGTWLPNDPRGSGSRNVYTPVLAAMGASHFGRRNVQPPRRIVRKFYAEAEPRLQFPVLRFSLEQINEVAISFAATIQQHR